MTDSKGLNEEEKAQTSGNREKRVKTSNTKYKAILCRAPFVNLFTIDLIPCP
jgi:hypothetical protein